MTDEQEDLASASDTVEQRGSHRELLDQFSDDNLLLGTVDAVIVPTVRPVDTLHEAIGVAISTGSTLVLLCSRRSAAGKAAELANRAGVDFIAVDVDRVSRAVLPAFRSDRVLARTTFRRYGDLSFKRNLGLLFSVLAGWRKVVFLDDDIAVPDPIDLRRAAFLLDKYRAVGLKVEGFPDNSVVCHANRESGGFQETYIGGGALAVDVREINSFFPDIYNEDWFFLYGSRSAVVGQVKQAAYDPYDIRRASAEEFGDSLAEGVYALLDMGRSIDDATRAYWAEFLTRRQELIRSISGSVLKSSKEKPEKAKIVSALGAAAVRCGAIKPEHCVRYLKAWRADRGEWPKFVAKLMADNGIVEGQSSPAEAVRALGIERAVRTSPDGVSSTPAVGYSVA